jgi:hypothetical protein
LTKAVDLALASAADLFDAIEACRWAALEARASKSKISSGFTASTPEELEAIFEKMSNDA